MVRVTGQRFSLNMISAQANELPASWGRAGLTSGSDRATRLNSGRPAYSIPSFLIRYRSARKLMPNSFAAAVLL
jgi:hypothetical protein